MLQPVFEQYTPKYLWENGIVPNLGTELLTNEGSFLYDVYAPALLEIWKVYLSMNALEPMFYIDETSGAYIDKMAGSFGLTRKPGVRASCEIVFKGTDGTRVGEGAVFMTEDNLTFTLETGVTIANGRATGVLIAAQPGAAYNIAAGEIKKAQRNYAGLTSFENEAAAGGVDEETDASLVGRFYAQLRQPATSGNGYHYQQWAREVPGVGGARVIGIWDGPGTVQVLLVDDSMRPVDPAVVQAAQAHIDALRPVGAEVTCAAATAKEIPIRAEVQLRADVTLAAVTEEFSRAMADYLHSLAAEDFCAVLDASRDDLAGRTCTVVYNKILGLLIDCDGVMDCSGLQVCLGTENVVVDAQSVPILGEVALHA